MPDVQAENMPADVQPVCAYCTTPHAATSRGPAWFNVAECPHQPERLPGDNGITICATCRTLWPCNANRRQP